ncbi:MAG TPA: type II secretion system F family protein [Candidatus Paceibacterota bacterium]|nr:type II secretion system F family protein [Candidatus Paceibacterota bacterium]
MMKILRRIFNAVRAETNKKSFSRMAVQGQIIFAKRLAILIRAGIPIAESLNMLEQQASGKSNAGIMRVLRERMEQGQTLAAGMRFCKNAFDNFSVNVVDMGEMSGTLALNLQYLASELKKRQELRRSMASALVYPSILALASAGILIMLVVCVFPKVLPIYRSFNYQLPWSTRFFVAVGDIVQSYWLLIVSASVFFVLTAFFLFRLKPVRLWFDRSILCFPLLGPLLASYSIANFSRITGLLLDSGMGIIETLRIVAEAMGNTAYRARIVMLAEGAARGEKLSDMMATDPVLFPVIVRQLIAVGETAGSLSSSLLYLAEMYEEEMNNLARNLTTCLEPALMALMGLMVGFIALSIITPIYGITQIFRP